MGFKKQKGIVEAARRNRRGLTESVVNDRKFVIENQHGQFWNGRMFGPLQAAERFDSLDDLPEELVDGETNLELYTFGSGTEPDDHMYFADAGDADPTAVVTAKQFPRFAESVDGSVKQFRMDNTSGFSQSELDTLNAAFEAEAEGVTDPDHLKHIADTVSNRADDILSGMTESTDSQSRTVTGDSKLDEYLATFPDDAQSWRDATDEIREIARAARIAYGEVDLNLSGDGEYENHPEAAPMNYHSFKKPSEWNQKSKEYIARLWGLMSQEAKNAFLRSVATYYDPTDSGYEESARSERLAAEKRREKNIQKGRWFKVPLVNDGSIGTRCGYGEGKTREEAVEDALRQARERDPNAYYEGGEVHFRADVYL